MTLPLLQIDAFAAEAFRGNSAAVCVLDTARPDAWMQSVAFEMNLSETAFVMPQTDGYSLRWFTPLAEVNLCGHATRRRPMRCGKPAAFPSQRRRDFTPRADC